MELEELKEKWTKLSNQLDNQKVLTNELVMKLAKQRSNSAFIPIVNFEKLGIGISTAMLIYILINYTHLTDWFSFASAICTAIIFIASMVMSITLIKKIKAVDIANNGYKPTLLAINRIKKFQHYMKWISAALAPFLLVFILPTFAAIHYNKSLLYDWPEFRESLIPGLILIPIILYFIHRFYSKKLKEIDALMDEFVA